MDAGSWSFLNFKGVLMKNGLSIGLSAFVFGVGAAHAVQVPKPVPDILGKTITTKPPAEVKSDQASMQDSAVLVAQACVITNKPPPGVVFCN